MSGRSAGIQHFISIMMIGACLCAFYPQEASGAQPQVVSPASADAQNYARYVAYFREVFQLMSEHYYFDIQKSDFERFLQAFEQKIYPNLLLEKKSIDYVRWRSGAYLVDFLKQPDDLFSRFLPPKPAEEFAKEVYGQKIDLGIRGHREGPGFVVDFVEPRSDAYGQGLREQDFLLRIDGKEIGSMTQEQVLDRLNPLAGEKTRLSFIQAASRKPFEIVVESREYFKQTVFQRPTGVADIYCLQIEKFNQGTPDDMLHFLSYLANSQPKGLVLDLRGNPGGPPLAARAISAFFLPNGEPLVYFSGKNRPRSDLDIPAIPQAFHFDWPLVILVDKMTGSASELFSGVMQDRRRAVVLGEATAGQVLLKSLFDLSDGSTLAMVVARGHFPDGRPFPFDGVHPDEEMGPEHKDKAVFLAARYLLLKGQ